MTTTTGSSGTRGRGTAAVPPPRGAELDRPAEVGAGTWFHNPATGEIALMRVAPADTDGQRIEADLWLQPGAAVAQPHVHAHLVERFEVVLGWVPDRRRGAARAPGRRGD
jgi:hypothetical protein